MVDEDRVLREYRYGVGKVYACVHHTCIPRVVYRLAPEEGSRAMVRHEDVHAVHETSGDDLVEKVSM